MRFFGSDKIEKISKTGFLFSLLVFIGVGGWLLYDYFNNSGKEEETNNTESTSTELADRMDNYPDKVILNENLQDITIYDSKDKAVKLKSFEGKNIILIFWASWCKYCKAEFADMEEYKKVLDAYEDTEIILVNKLDGEKESKEQALNYLKENNIPFDTYFDKDLKVYQELGIKIVPTMLGIDKNGKLKVCKPGNLEDAGQLAAFIDYLEYGASYATQNFITDYLTDTEGGVRVNLKETGSESPSGNDVLSESQGILMEYAVLKEDKELFEEAFQYVKQFMLTDTKLAGWMVTGKKSAASNSLVDDLRIYKALLKANELWGGYEDMLIYWEKNLYEYNTSNNHIVDSYDFKRKDKSRRITLCFADLESLALLKDRVPEYGPVYDNALSAVEGGYISDDFPFYYSWYNYKKKDYEDTELNMAEALYTVWNLTKAGKQKETTIRWLKDKVASAGIKARYTISGQVVKGYSYESTAIYALAAMIGKEIGDEQLVTDAIARMELLRVNEKGSELNGSFGTNDGEDIYSFDQCMALLAYAVTDN